MSNYLNIILFICSVFICIESRRNLRDYVVSHEYSSGLTREEFSVYDPRDKDLLCRLESSVGYGYNRLTNLVSYPTHQTIGSIRNVWSPFLYQGYFNVLDDRLNQWLPGQISQRYRPQGFRFTIEYDGRLYLMENKLGSSITEIREEKRPTYLLTRFYQTYMDPMLGSSKYNIKVYSNDLPDPIYILALYALESIPPKRRITFTPFRLL